MPEQAGWICPVCRRVYAPWVKECEACNGAKVAPVVEPWIPITPWYPWPYYPSCPGTTLPWNLPYVITCYDEQGQYS
jgi:hypothetical protein